MKAMNNADILVALIRLARGIGRIGGVHMYPNGLLCVEGKSADGKAFSLHFTRAEAKNT